MKLEEPAVSMARVGLALLLFFVSDGKISGQRSTTVATCVFFFFKPDKVIKDAFVFQALKVLTSLMAENLPPTRVRTWPRCSSEVGWSAGGL